MKVNADALDRAHHVRDTYEVSKAKFDAGDRKSGHWRILEKEKLIADELVRLAAQPPETKEVSITHTIYKLNLWQAGLFTLVGAVGTYLISLIT